MPKYTLPFKPVFGLTSGYLQTLLGSYGFPIQEPLSHPFIVQVSDNDQLLCLDSTPKGWTPNLPTIVLSHGLGGSSNSRYIVRISRFLFDQGQRVIRVNFRGCGPGEMMARQPSHAGRSGDLYEVCTVLKKQHPQSDIKLVGFSLSGNIVLKMLGELGLHAASLVESCIAICPAIDLKKGVESIGQPHQRVYEKYYLKYLMEKVTRKKMIYHDYPNINFPDPLKLNTFDNLYTAPLSGFKDAEEYYLLCSAKRVLNKIMVPTKILYALDDPIVPATSFDDLELPSSVSCYETKYGGHLGYLGWSGKDFWFRWMDKLVVKWLQIM